MNHHKNTSLQYRNITTSKDIIIFTFLPKLNILCIFMTHYFL